MRLHKGMRFPLMLISLLLIATLMFLMLMIGFFLALVAERLLELAYRLYSYKTDKRIGGAYFRGGQNLVREKGLQE